MILMPDLFSFAYVPNWYSQLDMLAEMALPEPWRFKNPIYLTKNPDTPILERYIHAIFKKQLIDYKDERNPSSAADYFHIENEFCCFHTGLYTRRYKAIYACFDRNKKKDSLLEWFFRGFADELSPMLRHISPLPKKPSYDGVQEYLDTIQELKSCSREKEYLEGLEKKLDYVVKCSFRNEIAPGAATTTAQFILRFGLVAVMLVGGILVTAGSLSIPMFILFLLFAGRIYDPFTSCFMLMAEVFSSLVSVKRMKQIDATPEQTGTNVCNNKGYDIEFKNVVFSYNEEPVLKGVSFVAKQGEVTALVGPSGSGKSTVSKLAARFWDADSGTITLGGVDVKTVEPETLFKNYAIVFQDVMLFDETVMENIRLGRGDATDEEVMAAARAAQCEEFIQRLPQGYQTNIGENGSTLSGGERQRISIARALLKNAPIVLLDEATASMDAESETLVQDALSVLLKDKTVMVIAHRMRTVANADKIVVLDDGKVSEMGTPAELMAKGGLYSHLVALQQGR